MQERAAQTDDLSGRGEPREAQALHRLGVLEFQDGRLQAARRTLSEALGIEPDDALILSDLGLVQASLNDPGEALLSFDRALALRPDLAEAHCRRGDLLRQLRRAKEALASYDRAIALDPRLAPALNNRGLVLMALGRPLDALASYDRLLAVQPDDVLALCNRGRAFQELGRAQEAVESYDQALRLRPDYLEVLNNRGVALQTLGRFGEALASHDRALELNPDYLDALINRGNLLKDLDRPQDALDSFDQALAVDPRSGVALNNRGNLLRDLGRLDEALESCEAALGVNPDFPEALSNRGFVLWKLGRPADALASYDRSLRLNPRQPKACNIRGLALLGLDRPDEAMASYERALALDPDFADALGNKGMLLIELGRLEEAQQAVERAIARSPRNARLYYILTLSRRIAPDDAHLEAMRQLLADPAALSLDDQIHLRFALAKAFEDIGDHAAWRAQLVAGAALQRGRLRYDEPKVLDGIARTPAVFSQQRLHEGRGLGDPSAVPVFIVGMPRSGSTLVEQMLASHPEAFSTGETDYFSKVLERLGSSPQGLGGTLAEQVRRIGEDYLREIIAAAPPGAERVVNKTLENFRFVGLIHLALPNARIIHTARDPMDTCLSCFSKLFGDSLPFSYDLGELGRYFRAYQGLMDHWRAALPEDVMLEVPYEAVVADPEGQARRMLAHCGLDWEPRCLDFHLNQRWVHTASTVQVRQPVYKTSIGRWRAHEAFLQPLIDELGA